MPLQMAPVASAPSFLAIRLCFGQEMIRQELNIFWVQMLVSALWSEVGTQKKKVYLLYIVIVIVTRSNSNSNTLK